MFLSVAILDQASRLPSPSITMDELYGRLTQDLGKLRNETLDYLGDALGLQVKDDKKGDKANRIGAHLMPKQDKANDTMEVVYSLFHI